MRFRRFRELRGEEVERHVSGSLTMVGGGEGVNSGIGDEERCQKSGFCEVVA